MLEPRSTPIASSSSHTFDASSTHFSKSPALDGYLMLSQLPGKPYAVAFLMHEDMCNIAAWLDLMNVRNHVFMLALPPGARRAGIINIPHDG